jgi:hypothetical protein
MTPECLSSKGATKPGSPHQRLPLANRTAGDPIQVIGSYLVPILSAYSLPFQAVNELSILQGPVIVQDFLSHYETKSLL